MSHKKLRCGQSPSYWWDFRHHDNGDMSVIVESDIQEQPIAEFSGGNAIDRAQSLIADLIAGRTKP